MSIEIIAESHTDHVTEAHLAFIRERFADRDGFFIETVELPPELPALRCDLHGPEAGSEAVTDAEARMERRPGREWDSRVCDREPTETRQMTVIAGPHGESPVVLFTAFGGPCAPREPSDPDIASEEERERSEAFWRLHALSAPR